MLIPYPSLLPGIFPQKIRIINLSPRTRQHTLTVWERRMDLAHGEHWWNGFIRILFSADGIDFFFSPLGVVHFFLLLSRRFRWQVRMGFLPLAFVRRALPYAERPKAVGLEWTQKGERFFAPTCMSDHALSIVHYPLSIEISLLVSRPSSYSFFPIVL